MMQRFKSKGTFIVLVLGFGLGLLSGCVTSGQVDRETTDLFEKMQKAEVHAYICAPKEYAMAQSNAYFAQWEADQGDSYKAKNHLAEAKIWFDKMKAKAFNPDGTFREGCEGDLDGDGILDSKDKCPEEAEDCDGDEDMDGCPEFDKDGDGIADEADKCPLDPEDKDGFEDVDGCPDKDNDLDGIMDEKDKCPNHPEDFDGFEDSDGCPEVDNDGDGIPDVNDKCPNKPEDFDGDQDDDGCPDLYKNIIIKQGKIELKQKIFFAFNKAKILPKSFEMLDEVAQALKDNPKINVRIEGHTDSKGSDRYNKKLSDSRAASVRMYMVAKGIDPNRMVSIGYGEERPIAENDTEEGREMNRRVEFFIVDDKQP